MRKLFVFAIAALFLMSGIALASSLQPAYQNAITIDGEGEDDQPPMFVKKVRYGAACSAGDGTQGIIPKLNSGDVVKWDTTSADGYTVSACTATTDYGLVCGVLVTDLQTQDSLGNVHDGNWGYMAVGGYCLADVDTSQCTAGNPLVLSTSVTPALTAFGTQNNQTQLAISKDIGTLLNDPGADGMAQVWLNLN